MRLLIFITALFMGCSQCANIFVMIPTPLYSHQAAFEGLWKKLLARGHNLTVVTTEPKTNPSSPNSTEINLPASRDIWNENFSKETQGGVAFWNLNDVCYRTGELVTQYQLSQPELQRIIHRKSDHHFDLVMVEIFSPELLSLGKLYNAPTILLATLGTPIGMYQQLGSPVHPVLNPDLNVPFSGPLTFKERLISTLYQWYQMCSQRFIFFPRKQKIIDKFFGGLVKADIYDLMRNVDLMLINVNPLLEGPRAIGPNIINVRGTNVLRPFTSLSRDLQEFLDNAKNGFIYFSLGSNVKSKDLGNVTLANIVKAFEQIPYKVLWKFESDLSTKISQNVKLIEWAPQQAILRHPNIKAFVTQCGIHSLEEAVSAKVPMIGMPFFGDQLRNARIIENKNIGKLVNHKPLLNPQDLKDVIMEVIEDKRYKTSIVKLAGLINDEPMSGLEKAVWWTEYVIRNKGAKELRNPAADIPLYQFYLLDVLGFIFLTSFLSIYLSVLLVRKLQQYCRRTWRRWGNSKFKTN